MAVGISWSGQCFTAHPRSPEPGIAGGVDKTISLQAFRSMKHQLSGQVSFFPFPYYPLPATPAVIPSFPTGLVPPRRDEDGPPATGSQPFLEGAWLSGATWWEPRKFRQRIQSEEAGDSPERQSFTQSHTASLGNIIHVRGNAVSVKVSKKARGVSLPNG